MPQLPTPATSGDVWGSALNSFLTAAHDNTAINGGKLKPDLASIVAGGKIGINNSTPKYAVDVTDSGSVNLTGTVSYVANSNTVTGSGTAFTTELVPGDQVAFFDNSGKLYWGAIVASVTSNTQFVAVNSISGAASFPSTTAKKSRALGFRVEDTNADTVSVLSGSGVGFVKKSTLGTNGYTYMEGYGSVGATDIGLDLRGPAKADRTIVSPTLQLLSSNGYAGGSNKGSAAITLSTLGDVSGQPGKGTLVDSGGTPPMLVVNQMNQTNNTSMNFFYVHQNGAFFSVPLTLTQAPTISSDRNLKTEIVPLSNSLEKIQQISGVSYFLKDKTISDKKQIGVIAQDVEAVFPELVIETEGHKAVNYSGLVAPLIESIKELKAEIEYLKAEMTSLKNR